MIKLSEVFFLINPFSGKKQSDTLVYLLKTKYPEIKYHVSFSRDEAARILAENIEKFLVVVIAGGDGTINQAIPFFMHRKDKILAVYPTGSGNGFAMETGFTKNIRKLMDAITKGRSNDIDIIRCNEHHAINIAGLGLDGYIANLFMHQHIRGFWKYAMLTAKALVGFSPFSADIETGGQTLQGKFMGIVLANTRQFGNRAYIAPKSKPTDGKIDVVLIKAMPPWQMFSFFIRLFTNQITDGKYIRYFQTSDDVQIKTNYTFAHADGEPFSISGFMDVRIIPGVIRILTISPDIEEINNPS